MQQQLALPIEPVLPQLEDFVLTTFRVAATIMQGVYYGYPLECVQAFVLMRFKGALPNHPEDNPYQGTGYVPSAELFQRPVEEVVGLINQHRFARLPFSLTTPDLIHHEEARRAYTELMRDDPRFKRRYNEYTSAIRPLLE
jgi:hypothetical protein